MGLHDTTNGTAVALSWDYCNGTTVLGTTVSSRLPEHLKSFHGIAIFLAADAMKIQGGAMKAHTGA